MDLLHQIHTFVLTFATLISFSEPIPLEEISASNLSFLLSTCPYRFFIIPLCLCL